MRTKGIGPRGLGISPLKQTKRQSIMQNEDGSAYTKEQAKNERKESLLQRERLRDSFYSNYNKPARPKGAAVGAGLIGGGGRALAKLGTRIAGALAKSRKTAKFADKLLNVSKRTSRNTSGNKKALEAFKKASPKDPTKTTRLSNYNNSPSSNLRQDGFGGTTSVGARKSYNNIGSN